MHLWGIQERPEEQFPCARDVAGGVDRKVICMKAVIRDLCVVTAVHLGD